MVQHRPNTGVGYLLALAATIIWSGNFIAARGLADTIPPVTLAFLRWMVAVMAVIPFGVRSVPMDFAIIKRHIGYLSLTAFLSVTLFNTLVYIAAHTAEALNLTLIAICSPVFTVIFARFFLKEPFTLRRTIGLVLAFGGVIALITDGDVSRLVDLTFAIGDVWMLIAAIIFGFYGILVRLKPKELSQATFLTAIFVLGILFLIPWVLWELSQVKFITFSLSAAATILYLGVGPSLIAFYCWNRSITIIGPVRTGFVYYSLPLFGGLEAFLFLGEPLHWVHLWSGAAILLGVIIATRE